MAPRETENMYRITVKILKFDVVYKDISQLIYNWPDDLFILLGFIESVHLQISRGQASAHVGGILDICGAWVNNIHFFVLVLNNPNLQQRRCSKYHSSSSQVLGTKLKT